MIISTSRIGAAAQVYGAAQPTRVGLAKKASEDERLDQVQISEVGQSFSEMLQKLKDTPDVRQDKVDYYERAIADGSYQVAAEDIAQKMLELRF